MFNANLTPFSCQDTRKSLSSTTLRVYGDHADRGNCSGYARNQQQIDVAVVAAGDTANIFPCIQYLSDVIAARRRDTALTTVGADYILEHVALEYHPKSFDELSGIAGHILCSRSAYRVSSTTQTVCVLTGVGSNGTSVALSLRHRYRLSTNLHLDLKVRHLSATSDCCVVPFAGNPEKSSSRGRRSRLSNLIGLTRRSASRWLISRRSRRRITMSNASRPSSNIARSCLR